MAKLYSNIETRRLNINLPISIDNRINNYRNYYGLNFTNAVIMLLNNSLKVYELEKLEEEYYEHKKEKCNYNIAI